jgi:hypothetical protein
MGRLPARADKRKPRGAGVRHRPGTEETAGLVRLGPGRARAIWVLDPAASHLAWQPPGQEFYGWHHQEALLGTDGRTLTLSFTGSPENYTSYPEARVLESGNAVAVIPISKELVTGWRTAVGRTRQVTATLGQRLDNRVLLDGTGSPVMVTSM